MHVLINNEIVIKTISISKDKEQLIWDELEKDHHVVKMPAHWIVSIQPYHTIEDVRAVYDLLTAHGISNSVVYKRMALSFAKDDVDSQYTACIVASDTFKQIGAVRIIMQRLSTRIILCIMNFLHGVLCTTIKNGTTLCANSLCT